MELQEIDLLDRDVFTQGVPHEWLTYLRNNHPVYHHPEPDGPGFWVITKYDDLKQVSREPNLFSSWSWRTLSNIPSTARRTRFRAT